MPTDAITPTYTAISFAPVQSFIEKSRKLRDLYGASGLLSYLAQKLIEARPDGCQVISPGSINLQRGMPNRILIHGNYPRNDVAQALTRIWQAVMEECCRWVENRLQNEFPKEAYQWQEQWDKFGRYHWEVFWGHGDSPITAMQDLETRKLRRDWIAVNWVGESSSLSGVDAIAWPGLGALNSNPGWPLSRNEKIQQNRFYELLSSVLENKEATEDPVGKFLAPNERLSIPELAKRLVTWPEIAKALKVDQLEQGFTEIHRNTRDGKGQWTGWFMGDGDHVGDYLQAIATKDRDQEIKAFSQTMRAWGQKFTQEMPKQKGRVVYAGGDDFLGVLYGQSPQKPIPRKEALEWLMQLNERWQQHGHDITLSVGFIWAAPDVPQRDVLQHCRETQKRSKKLGRDRITIRILFNSGQYVQWTCRWCDLEILKAYRDRDDQGWDNRANWAHIYTDWAHLKARHTIPAKANERYVDDVIAIEFFDIYFPGYKEILINQGLDILGTASGPLDMINWIDGAIQVGWYLTPTE